MLTLSRRAMIVAMAILACVVLPSIYALIQMRVIDHSIERSNAAGDVRRSLEDVEDLADAYAHYIERGGDPVAPQGRALLRRTLVRLTDTRQLIAREVRLSAPEDAGEEQRELARIDAIEDAVRSTGTTAGRVPDWSPLIQSAIANERAEVKANELIVRQRMNEIEAIIAFEAIVATLVCAAGLSWMRSRIVLPLQRLTAGASALAEGRYDARVEPAGLAELDATIQLFNHMADQVQAQRGTMLATQGGLEAEVARRTAELSAARDELAALAARRADFLADVSHELRTPIAIVRGEAEVTLRNRAADPADYRSALALVLRQAEALSQLVDDLLFVARQDAGTPALKLRTCDLGQVVRINAEDVRCLLEGDGGAITVRTEGQALVQCDETKIGQVMRILIDNAIRYCSIEPRIDISVMPAPGGTRVIVRDNGIGIAAHDIPQIFERFRRGSSNGSAVSASGNGLGLPLARSIIEAHGGTIDCHSVPGEGTTMAIFLPASTLRAVA